MKIDYNPEGKWSVESVKTRYRELSLSLGGVAGFQPEPRKHTNQRGASWTYNIMESVVDGIRLGDMACIQLSIEYIHDGEMGSTTGYIRERMARALRNASLTKNQKAELAKIFLGMLESDKIYKEFKEYTRLFKRIGVAHYAEEIERFKKSNKQYIRRAAERLLA